MTFAGISLIVLPILPNKTFGPLDVLNPHNIWLMVVLIVGISFVGYFIYKIVGKKTGIITLSLSNLMKSDGLETSVGWRLVLLATLSNLLFKGIMAAVLGTRQLTKWISFSFGTAIIAGFAIMWRWPESWQF